MSAVRRVRPGGEELDEYGVAPKAELLAALVAEKSPAAVLVASTAEGREVAARLAVKTGFGVITDAVDLAEGLVAEQSIFGGAIIVQSRVRAGTPIVAVRPNAVAPEPAPGAAELENVSIEVSDAAKSTRVTERVVQERGERPELTEASIVVSGGRGVGSADNFACATPRGRAGTLGARIVSRSTASVSSPSRGARLPTCQLVFVLSHLLVGYRKLRPSSGCTTSAKLFRFNQCSSSAFSCGLRSGAHSRPASCASRHGMSA